MRLKYFLISISFLLILSNVAWALPGSLSAGISVGQDEDSAFNAVKRVTSKANKQANLTQQYQSVLKTRFLEMLNKAKAKHNLLESEAFIIGCQQKTGCIIAAVYKKKVTAVFEFYNVLMAGNALSISKLSNYNKLINTYRNSCSLNPHTVAGNTFIYNGRCDNSKVRLEYQPQEDTLYIVYY